MQKSKNSKLLVRDNLRELTSLYNAKINQIKMIYNRGYMIPSHELRMINLSRTASGKTVASKDLYTVTKFKTDYFENKLGRLLDNVYLRFLGEEIDPNKEIFEFINSDNDFYEIVPVYEPDIEEDGGKAPSPEKFGHIETEGGRMFASKKVYNNHENARFHVLVVRFPKLPTAGGKITKPNAETLQDISKVIIFPEMVDKIYIFRDNLTGPSEKARKQIINLQVFTYDDLIIDIVSHVLVPKHTLLSQSESFKIKAIFGAENMSQISHNDIITIYYNAKIGDVFLISRQEFVNYGFIHEKEHYRVVVYTV